METSASQLCAQRGWAACSGYGDVSHQAPSHPANRVQRVSPREQKGRAAHGTLRIRYCWKFMSYAAKHHKMWGRRCPQQPQFRKQDLNSLFIFDSQRLALVSAQGPCSLPVSIALGAILLAVAGLAVDLLSMHSNGGAVQVLLTDH